MVCSFMSVFMYFIGFELSHHLKDDVILPNSGVAKNLWLFYDRIGNKCNVYIV